MLLLSFLLITHVHTHFSPPTFHFCFFLSLAFILLALLLLMFNIKDPSLHLGWKTCAVIPEMEVTACCQNIIFAYSHCFFLQKEINTANSVDFKQSLATLLAVERLLQKHQVHWNHALMVFVSLSRSFLYHFILSPSLPWPLFHLFILSLFLFSFSCTSSSLIYRALKMLSFILLL